MQESEAAALGRQTAVGAIWMIAWRVTTRLLGMISTLVLARVLVPGDFGLIAMATGFAGAIEGLSLLGLDDALIRKAEADRGLYDTAFSIQALRGLANGAVVAIMAGPASAWFQEPRLMPILLILAALTAVSGFENIGIVDFRRNLQFSKEFLLFFLPRIGSFGTTVAACLLLRSYWALLIGIAVAKFLRFVTTYVIHPYRPRFGFSRWRDLAGFSFWTWMTGLATVVWERSDTFILGRALGPAMLGLMAIAAEIAVMPISELVSPASRALYAGISAARRSGSNVAGLALPASLSLLLLILPLTITVSAASGPITDILLGSRWLMAQPLIAISAWYCVFSVTSHVCGSVFVAIGRVRENFLVMSGASLVRIGLVTGAVLLTHQPGPIMAVGVMVGMIEALFFSLRIIQLEHKSDDFRTQMQRNSLGTARMFLSACVTAAVLYWSQIGWTPAGEPIVIALMRGAVVGWIALTIFAAVQFAQWRLAGRPSGPETRVIQLLASLIPPGVVRRWRPKPV
ncbi:MAG: oligosaccharide flippase family protein [Acetobacteraceae bacterium]|nr:oligosaccharide flippase family protein [Acetobacteraceae bacterium]MBV8520885.1 oligosaccharide flippase family protein [Acetobacteraceae bacterium]